MTKNVFWALAFLALVGCDESGVYPPTAKKLKSLELGEAVRLFMPALDEDHIPWSFRNKHVIWIDDSYDLSGINPSRTGILRINVNGIKSKILKNSMRELVWSVEYIGIQNTNLGVSRIIIKPGLSYNNYYGDTHCFGAGAENCTFNPLKSLINANIDVDVLCTGGPTSGKIVGLELTAKDKAKTMATWINSYGSGGSTSWLTLYVSSKPRSLCE